MKKLKVISYVTAFLFLAVACKSTQPIRQAEKTLKGNWTLTDVTYSRPGTFNVNLYGDTGADCFKGSTWQFIPNNNSGTYTFNGGDCDTAVRNFKWTIPTLGDQYSYSFMMKPLTVKKKSIEGNRGFRTGLASLEETTMVWTQKLQFEGKPFTITMNFTKNQ